MIAFREMSFSSARNERGVSALTLILLVFGLLLPMMLGFSMIHLLRARNISADYKRLVARETAKSSFLVMEAALRRRLWEMPPDSNCLKSTSFFVTGTTPDGADFQVNADYDLVTNTLRMVAKATFNGVTVNFEKKSKVLDASEFLVFSKSTDPTYIVRSFDPKTPAGFIGKNRKIYFEGPVTFRSMVFRPNSYFTSWSAPTPMVIPGELGMIIQGERMYFLKGVSNFRVGIDTPNTNEPVAYSLLSPYALPSLAAQTGAGAAVITSDYNLAMQIQTAVLNGTSAGLPPMSTLKKSIYPAALFCGTPPLMTSSAVDNGCYMGDPDQRFIMSYHSGGAANWGNLGDYTCFSENSGNENWCASSEKFPNGFIQWRKDASLENVLYGSDGVQQSYTPINWDNMEALKEDALACGMVVSKTTSYVDCDLSNFRIVNNYAYGINSCESIVQLDLETLPGSLNNFNPANYTDPTKKNLLLRRVLYADSPTELAQTMSPGLSSTTVDPLVRENLSLWMVNEDRFILKPFQLDLTSPIDVNPAVRRQLYFNLDPAGVLRSLNLVLLTPEQLQIISPQHIPYTLADMQAVLPIVGGKIKPKNHILTDSYHEENDGFKYGMRDVNVGNLILISNTAPMSESSNNSGFNLRGLWSGSDSGSAQLVRNACMFSDPVSGTAVDSEVYPSQPMANFPWIPPALPAAVDSVVPPKGSRFYSAASTTFRFIPNVFTVQSNATSFWSKNSRIFHTGARIMINFDNSTPNGKKNLAYQLYLPFDTLPGSFTDLSDRKYKWNQSYYYPLTAGSQCKDPIYTLSGSLDQPGAFGIKTNSGNGMDYIQNPLPDTVSRMGTLFGADLPFIELAR